MMAKRRELNRGILAAKQKEYRKRKPEISARAAKNYVKNNREKVLEYHRKYYRANHKRIRAIKNEYQNKRMANDPSFRIRCSISRRLASAMFDAKTSKKSSVMKYLGCSIHEFSAWLEKKFNKKMTWENYGNYWNIDHILPCASFDHTDEKQVHICWHFTNMQPLPAIKNLKKSDKITAPQMFLQL